MNQSKYLQSLYNKAKKENLTFKDIVSEIVNSGINYQEIGLLISIITNDKKFDIK
jgi:DNA-directed RNA polymerase delta subunit